MKPFTKYIREVIERKGIMISEMREERARQIGKWGRQRLSLRVWLWVWLEEVGEYYKAKLELRNACLEFMPYNTQPPCDEGIACALRIVFWSREKRKELVQVLTVLWAFAADWRPWHGLWRIG